MRVREVDCLLPVPSGSLQIAEGVFLADTPFSFTSDRVKNSPIQLSLVIPTYQEAQNIKKIVSQLTNLLNQVMPNAYELIVVDDNSPDQTWKIAQALMVNHPRLKVMRRFEERGLSTAVIRGWQVSRGEVLGVIDADLQHSPDTLLKLWSEIEKGADLAVASRHLEGGGIRDWSLLRQLLSRGAQIIGLILLPDVLGRVSDPMSGYFLVRRSCLVGCPMSPLGYKILIEVLARGKVFRIAELGYVFQERQAGKSKVTAQQYLDYLQHLVRLRLSLGYIGQIIEQFSTQAVR
ncbi:MAG: polyprenol monophosphomannose synthase [Coleofasciculaceae cyanobacterium]